jgi:hypothetical protein
MATDVRASAGGKGQREMTTRNRLLGVLLTLYVAGVPACGTSEVEPETLMFEITSDAPMASGSLDRVRILFAQETAAGLIRFPESVEDGDLQISPDFNPVERAEVIGVRHSGTTFELGTPVLVTVSGISAQGAVLTLFMGSVDLASLELRAVHLMALDPACDADLDGFPDCETEGCCEAGPDGTTPLGDCDASRDDIGPWSNEDACTQCGDGIDQDCDGFDTPCVDVDEDGSPACVDCHDGDDTIAPGLSEICDGKDNNCNDKIDEAFLGLGGPCGQGECAGGLLVCAPDGSGAVCSTSQFATETDTCGDGLDNDCNGLVDEGCEIDDVDGDGVSEAQGDCNDYDSGVFPPMGGTPGATEPCCLLGEGLLTEEVKAECDRDCDGEVNTCAQDDADGDGYGATGGVDCDDTDPMVNPGAPEKCGDGVDQDCFGGDQPCSAIVDNDGDGWYGEGDCDDSDPDVNPAAAEVCNALDDDCDGFVDDGNPGTDDSAVCGSDVGVCETGTLVCAGAVGPDFGPGDVTCHGDVTEIPEICDGEDNDCDGTSDEDFTWESLSMGEGCDGTGECITGTVVCFDETAAICSSMVGYGNLGGPNDEICDGFDQDCDGVIDEAISDVLDSDCAFDGVCQVGPPQLAGTCDEGGSGTWTCDYSSVPDWEPGVEPWCDGLDNDCDGLTDDEFEIGTGCDGDDADDCKNGVWICDPANKATRICDESGAANVVEVCDGFDNDCDNKIDETFDVFPSPEACGVGACDGGLKECTADGETTQCNTMPAGPDQSHDGTKDKSDPEVCNNADDNCDGQVDEDLNSIVDAGCDTNGVCGYAGVASALCTAGSWFCTYTHALYQAGSESGLCDGHDNDCDGQLDEDFGGAPAGNVSYTEPTGKALYLGNPCGLGECWADSGATNTVQCDPLDPAKLYCPAFLPESETCDNSDQDCDGAVDEDFTEPWGTKLQGALYAVDNLKQKGDECGIGDCYNGQVACDPNDPLALRCTTDGQASLDTCNAVDDDCDGSVDEDFVTGGAITYSGGPFQLDAGKQKGDACGTGACTGGTVVCDGENATGLTCSTLVAGSPELCNNLDDDCDGQVDEDFKAGGLYGLWGGVNPADAGKVLGQSCGFGECDGGIVICDSQDATQLTCSTYSNVDDDTCDGDDNDCDGGVDEGFKAGGIVSLPATPYGPDGGKVLDDLCGTGSCKNGEVVCSNDGLSLECSKWSNATPEICDYKDNDCDGTQDENFSAGGDQPYTEIFSPFEDKYLGESCGTGDCASGQVVCANEDITCSTAVLAAAADASCDGEDDDCDGIIDNFFQPGEIVSLDDPYTLAVETLGLGEACGVGACQGTVECVSNSTLHCSGEGQESADETCNGIDEDCDAVLDDDVPGLGDPCDGADADLCLTGTIVCPADLSSPDGVCDEAGAGETEICNDLDDDCDTQIDETFPLKGTSCDGVDADQCAKGMWACQLDGSLACVGDTPNEAEVCGGGDEDCDGSIDEGYDLTSDVSDCGACGNDCLAPDGVASAACDAGSCEIVACEDGEYDIDLEPTTGCEYTCTFIGPDETCNGDDDDCDGLIDEDLDGTACDLNGDGCFFGTLNCNNGSGTCAGDNPCPGGQSCVAGACTDA